MFWAVARIGLILWGLVCLCLAAIEMVHGPVFAADGSALNSPLDRVPGAALFAVYGAFLLCPVDWLARSKWRYGAAACFAAFLGWPLLDGMQDQGGTLVYAAMILAPTLLASAMLVIEWRRSIDAAPGARG